MSSSEGQEWVQPLAICKQPFSDLPNPKYVQHQELVPHSLVEQHQAWLVLPGLSDRELVGEQEAVDGPALRQHVAGPGERLEQGLGGAERNSEGRQLRLRLDALVAQGCGELVGGVDRAGVLVQQRGMGSSRWGLAGLRSQHRGFERTQLQTNM